MADSSALTGNQYADLVAAYLVEVYGPKGLTVYREVSLGKTIIGKNRRIDIFCLHEASGKALALECKYQSTNGTVDEKIPYAIDDLRAMHIPAWIVYAGEGFSPGVLHMLAGCEVAASCRPDDTLQPTAATRELDHVVALTYRWWDVILAKKSPFVSKTPALSESLGVKPRLN